MPCRSCPAPGATLVVPEAVVGRAEDGTRWITVVSAAGDPAVRPTAATAAADLAGPRRPGRRQPQAYTLTGAHSPEWWSDLVQRATKAMADGDAREGGPGPPGRRDDRPADRPLRRARSPAGRRTPGATSSASARSWRPAPSCWWRVAGDIVRAHPMAGTAPRGGDPATDQRLAASLLASPTYRHEHQITIDVVHDTLLNWCSYVDYEAEPSVVAVANLQHLATLVEGRLSPPDAVGARPRGGAAPDPRGRRPPPGRGRRLDRSPRGHRPAPLRRDRRLGRRRRQRGVGGRRCAAPRSTGRRPGCGPATASSPTATPTTELAETRIKFQAMLSALVRP